MPNGEATELPEFPTRFTEVDERQMRELEEQRKVMQRIYLQHFTPSAWEAKPEWEKHLRTTAELAAVPSVLHTLRSIIPGEELQWGFTPAGARKYRLKSGEEYAKLKTARDVSYQLDNIQVDLRLLACQGEYIDDPTELMRRFPEIRDWSPEGRAYLAAFAQGLRGLTAEQTLRVTPEMPVITEEMFEEWGRARQIDPRYILSSIALSQDLEVIKDALQSAYPPAGLGEEERTEQSDNLYQELLQAQEAENIRLGIIPHPEESPKDVIQRKHEKFVETEGKSIQIIDEETGAVETPRVDKNNIAWYENEPLGVYDWDKKKVYSMMPDGTVIQSNREEEGWLKDNILDPLYVGGVSFIHGVTTTVTSLLPMLFVKKPEITRKEYPLPKRWYDWQEKAASNIARGCQERFLKQTAESEEWFVKHPELLPKPEYELSPWKHPELLKDPSYYVYNITSSLAYSLSVWGTIMGVSAATGGNLPLGLTAGLFVAGAPEEASITKELVSMGIPFEEAKQWGAIFGVIAGGIEIVTDLPLLGTFFKPVKKFIDPFWKTVTKMFTNRVLKATVTGITIPTIEGMEEVATEVIQNAILHHYDESKKLLEGVSEAFIRGVIASLPFGALGGAASYRSFKNSLSPEMQAKLDEQQARFEKAGATEEQAQVMAVNEIAKTEEGAKQVTEAIEAIREEHEEFVASSPEVRRREARKVDKAPRELAIHKAELKLINEQITVFEKSLQAGEQKAKTLVIPSEKAEAAETAASLRTQLAELVAEKSRLQSRITELQEFIKVPPPVPELAVPFRYTTAEAWDAAPVSERAALAKEVGLKGKVGSKPAVALTPDERVVLARKVPAPEKTIEQEAIEQIAPEPVAEALAPQPKTMPETIDGRPCVDTIEEQREAITDALRTNPNVAKTIVYPILRDMGKRWDAMSRDERIEACKTAKMGKALREELADKSWDEIPPTHQQNITLGSIPDGSVRLGKGELYADKRYIFQWLQEKTGLPFYQLFKRMEAVQGIATQVRDSYLDRVDRKSAFRKILRNKEALARVEQELCSRNPALKVAAPEVLSDTERMLADTIEQIFKEFEPHVRYLRFLREYDQTPTLDGINKVLNPEDLASIKAELQECINYYEIGDMDGLWAYVQDKEWGVIGSGYTPWIILKPGLMPPAMSIRTTRGAARLMHREGVSFPEGMRTLVQRLGTYLRQINTYFYLRPELKTLDELFSRAYPKLDMRSQNGMLSNFRSFSKELQGLPSEESLRAAILRRVYRQAMAAVFLHPWLAFRNIHQHLAFFPDRTELLRVLIQRPPAALRVKMRVYYDSLVSQMTGIRRDYMFTEEETLIPGTGWLVRLAQKLSLYPHSDNIPRMHSFYAATGKAWRASQQFMKDGDIKRWERDSGVRHLRLTEQNYAKELLIQEKVNFGIPGIRDCTGAEAASIYIGHEIANMTHFVYDRAFRAEIEQGEIGRTIFNLIVFPRSYAQRIFMQLNKTFGKGEQTIGERLGGLKDVTLILVVGAFISEWLKNLTGRSRRAYNPFDIIRWDLGGLALGAATDLTKLVGLIVGALDPTADEESKRRAMGQIPGLVTRQADVFIPFYRNIIDSIEAATGTRNWDVHKLRELRAWLDKNYTPEEIETMERTLVEKIRKAVLSGEPPDPDIFDKAQDELVELEAQLGQVDAEGRFYTLRNLASDIDRLTGGIDDDMLTEDYHWSPLVIYYLEGRDEYRDFLKLSTVGDKRDNYRRENLEFNAWCCFWGFYKDSLYFIGTTEWNEFINIMRTLFDGYQIDARMHPMWADWGMPLIRRPK